MRRVISTTNKLYADGYRAGLEAAAKRVEHRKRHRLQMAHDSLYGLAAAIRALPTPAAPSGYSDAYRAGLEAAAEACDWYADSQPGTGDYRVGRFLAATIRALPAPSSPESSPERVTVDYDGFTGDVIGTYRTREGKEGVVVQQDGTKVVHVYGRKRVSPAPAPRDCGDAECLDCG